MKLASRRSYTTMCAPLWVITVLVAVIVGVLAMHTTSARAACGGPPSAATTSHAASTSPRVGDDSSPGMEHQTPPHMTSAVSPCVSTVPRAWPTIPAAGVAALGGLAGLIASLRRQSSGRRVESSVRVVAVDLTRLCVSLR